MHMKKYELAIKKAYKEDNKIYLNRQNLRIRVESKTDIAD